MIAEIATGFVEVALIGFAKVLSGNSEVIAADYYMIK
jgi:hypothetical protein